MNKPVDPNELDLGAFEQMPTESLIERAMRTHPMPPAMHEMQAPRPHDPDKITQAPVSTVAAPSVEKQSRFPFGFGKKRSTNDAEKPQDEGITRRGFLRKARNAAITGGVIGGGYMGYETLFGASNTNMALLKKDHALNQLGLVHRRADLSLLKFADREGADALTFTKDNLESLVVSPELALKLKQDESSLWRSSDDKNNIDDLQVRLRGTPRNIYMPYHLFAGAVSFSVYPRYSHENVPYQGALRAEPGELIVSSNGQDTRVVLDDGSPLKAGERRVALPDGGIDRYISLGTRTLKPGERIFNDSGKQVKVLAHPKLVISIHGPNKAKDLPITQDIANAAESAKDAVADTATGWWGQIAGAWDDFKDWSGIGGDGVDTRATEAARHDAAILAREGAKPHPQEKADFYLEMDYPADGKLPNLHFFNGRSLLPANYHILGEELAAAVENDPRFGMRIIGNSGSASGPGTDYIQKHKDVGYYSEELRRCAEGATLHADSNIEDGVLTQMGTGLKKFAITDNKLNSYEEAALSIASGQIERSEDGRWTLKDRFAHRVLGTPDQNIGR